jgi:C4-dicarboxylate transporter DctM subunit
MEVAILFTIVVGLMLIGVPIAVSLGMASILFLLALGDTSLASIAQTFFQAMAGHYTLLAIPFFILASSFMSTGGVARRIIRFSVALVGHVPGGLAIAGVFACMMFAALSGSSPATVVAIGSIVIAGMHQVGYTKEFAAGVIANAGTLGILIPPSIVMVVYAAAVEVSVGRMFLAGVLPGLMAGSMLMITIYIMARVKNLPKGEWQGWDEVAAAVLDAAFGLVLIIIILGGIYGGIFTPTEAAAVACVYAFFAAIMIYRDMGPLKGKGWLRTEEILPFGLGLRVVAFAVIGFILHWSLGKAGVYAEGWGIIVATVWVVICLGTGWAMTHFESQRHRVAWPIIMVIGAVPGLIFGYWALVSIYQAMAIYAAESMIALLLTVLLAAVVALILCAATIAPAIIFTFSLHGAAREGQGTGFGSSLLGGARAMGRGVAEAVIYLPASIVHKDTRKTLFESGRLTVTLMFIIANALILKHVLTDEQIPQQIASAMLSAGFGPIMFLVIVNVILLIGGQFMEPSGLLVIVAPLVFPIAMELGIDPIHLGIIMVVNMEIGMITPPVGLNLFVTSGVANMPMMSVVRAALPFLAVLFVFLIMVTYIPWISTVLPNAMMGPELILK